MVEAEASPAVTGIAPLGQSGVDMLPGSGRPEHPRPFVPEVERLFLAAGRAGEDGGEDGEAQPPARHRSAWILGEPVGE